MTNMSKQINFTIVPEDPSDGDRGRRQYANFCAVAHTPFDMTLTFCDVRPLSERDIRAAEQTQTVQAPLVARVALPFAVIPGLIAALQEQLRSFQEAQQTAEVPPAPKGQLH
jgi:Protein of unknown function (DUF3467)